MAKKIETKIKKQPKKEKSKKIGFIKSMKAELAKVKWPESKEVIKYSVATIVMCLFIGVFFLLLQFLSSLVKGLI